MNRKYNRQFRIYGSEAQRVKYHSQPFFVVGIIIAVNRSKYERNIFQLLFFNDFRLFFGNAGEEN